MWPLLVSLWADAPPTPADPGVPWWLSGAVVTGMVMAVGAVAAAYVKVVGATSNAFRNRNVQRLAAEAQQAKIDLDAQAQAFRVQQDLIKEQAERIDRSVDAWKADFLEQSRQHAACEERCRGLEAANRQLQQRVTALEEQVRGMTVWRHGESPPPEKNDRPDAAGEHRPTGGEP